MSSRMPTDLRYAFRQFRKYRVSTAIAITSLALGIGGATSVFSVINGVLLHPFPYAGADRMVTLRVTDTAGYNGFSNYLLLSARQFQDIQKSPVLDGAIATDSWDMAITGEDLPQAVHTGKISANAFEYFGVPPVIGREFVSDDGPSGQAPRRVAVLSYRFWQGHYGGSPAAVGKTIQLDHENYTIIGVVPARFEWFHSDLYIPLHLADDPDRVEIVDARLKPGVSIERATAALTPLIQAFEKESPKHFPRQPGLRIRKLNAATEDRYQRTFVLVFCAVMVLLIVGSTNVALLLLARAAGRQQELSVRATLGASRARLVRQLVSEAILLASVGCLAGAGLAQVFVPRIVRVLPDNSFPNAASIHVNGTVLLFAVFVSLSTGLICGIWPALRSSRADIANAMQAQSIRTSGARNSRRLQTSLIAAQAALTVVLLAAAGASIRTFVHLYETPLGYDPRNLVTVALQFPDGTHLELQERQRFYADVRERVSRIPGVKSAAIYPFGFPPHAQFVRRLELFDQPAGVLNVATNPVGREFFQTLRIPILKGTVWSEEETERAAHVAVVNEAFVHRYWPAGDAVGRRLRLPDFTAFTSWMLAHSGSNDWLQVLGVVGNTPNDGLGKPAVPAVYLPLQPSIGGFIQPRGARRGQSSPARSRDPRSGSFCRRWSAGERDAHCGRDTRRRRVGNREVRGWIVCSVLRVGARVSGYRALQRDIRGGCSTVSGIGDSHCVGITQAFRAPRSAFSRHSRRCFWVGGGCRIVPFTEWRFQALDGRKHLRSGRDPLGLRHSSLHVDCCQLLAGMEGNHH